MAPRDRRRRGRDAGEGTSDASELDQLRQELNQLRKERDQFKEELDNVRAEKDDLEGQVESLSGLVSKHIVDGGTLAQDSGDDEEGVKERRVTRGSKVAGHIQDWRKLIKTAKKHGCRAEVVVRDKLGFIESFAYEDEFYPYFEDWAHRNSAGKISVLSNIQDLLPKWNDHHNPVCSAEYGRVMMEIRNIMHHLSQLKLEDFGDDEIPDPDERTDYDGEFEDDRMALGPLFDTLRDPPRNIEESEDYPKGVISVLYSRSGRC